MQLYQRRSGHVALNRVQQSCEGVRVVGPGSGLAGRFKLLRRQQQTCEVLIEESSREVNFERSRPSR